MRGKAIVVGAGIAGLTAAYRLKNVGFGVSVIEAGNAVGGRMSTVERWGFRFDTGAIVLTRRYSQRLRLAKDVGLAKLSPRRPRWRFRAMTECIAFTRIPR